MMDRLVRWMDESAGHTAYVYFTLGMLCGMAVYALFGGHS